MHKKHKQQGHRLKVFGIISLAILAIGGVLSAVGISQAVKEIHGIEISKTPDAILASAGVEDGGEVSLNIIYFDQLADNCVNIYDLNQGEALESRQFEWSKCDYYNSKLEQGLVDYYLNDEYLPTGLGGDYISNRGMTDLTRWFSNIEGKSQSYTGQIQLKYNRENATFSYNNDKFYPLDDAKFSANDSVNNDGHNHLFTMSFAVPFTPTASGEEQFTIEADDDTFVFVGDRLALDLGGIHEPVKGQFLINKDGEVLTSVGEEDYAYSGINVEAGEGSIIRIFHADRDSNESIFNVALENMSLEVANSELADASGIQIAYDPTDPSYIKPLGRSMTVRPDNTKGYMVMATIEGIALVVVAILTIMVAHLLIKNKS
ncbi:hypothetical protein IKG10_03065 [Candidatus Saccharibacteria bacterium]|nr:hypothetical protein [Candidatus Saccharibacteria bacterium]